MPVARTDDAERLVKLALYVQAHEPVTFDAIRLGLNEYALYEGADEDERRKQDMRARRMFERDKAALAEFGVFFAVDQDGRYRLDRAASFAAPMELTDAQGSMLRLMCAALLEDGSYPLKNELRMVLAKIGDELGLPDLLPGGGAGLAAGNDAPAGLGKVRKAIGARKRLRFEYTGAGGKVSRREVEPFGCYFLHKRCYVVAFDPSAGEAGAGGGQRTFRLDRMARMSVNAKNPTEPDFEPRAFDAGEYRKLPFQIGGEHFGAVVRFDGESAWQAERLCSGQGSFEEASDGDGGNSLLWHVDACDARGLAAWCIEHGPGVKPVAPAEAQDAYRTGLERALEVCRER